MMIAFPNCAVDRSKQPAVNGIIPTGTYLGMYVHNAQCAVGFSVHV